jgi:anti-sigma B factor antagonist
MAIEFEIEDLRVDDHTHLVAVAGEIDLFSAPELKRHVLAAIGDDVTTLVVDLSETTFIDSSSLGVLISAHRRLRARRGTLTVVCSHEAIVKTFRITGLDGVFRIVSSRDEALDNGHVTSGS